MGSTPQVPEGALPTAAGALLKLQPHGATPPVNAYVTQTQFLQILVFNAIANLTVTVYLQMLLPDGSISQNAWNLTPSTTRSQNGLNVPLAEGFILEVSVLSTPQQALNRTFCKISIISGSGGGINNSQVLCAGYLNKGTALSYPNGPLISMSDGAGAVVDVTGTTPGAGAEISETVPTGVIWTLKAFSFTLTASAAVANRFPNITVDDGANIVFATGQGSALAASGTFRFSFGDNTQAVGVFNNFVVLGFPSALRLMPGYRIRTSTTNLQAGDQYSAPQYLMQEWLFG